MKTALQSKGSEAQGFALAQSAFTSAVADSTITWTRIVYGVETGGKGTAKEVQAVGLVHLDQAGRASFRKHLKELHKQALATKPGDDTNGGIFKTSLASAWTRLSQVARVCKAIDAGFDVPFEGDDRVAGKRLSFDTVLALVKEFEKGSASNVPEYAEHGDSVGPTARKGRPALSAVEKFTRYMEKNIPPEAYAECMGVLAGLVKQAA